MALNNKLRIAAYAGRGLGFRCIQELFAQGYKPENIFVMHDDPHEDSWAAKIVRAFEDRSGVILDPSLSDQRAVLGKLNPDAILVFNWRKLLPQDILDLPRYGTIGVHAALLPQYRGFAPLNWALINGEKEVGATLFWLDAKLDSGPIVKQTKIEVQVSDDIVSLSGKVEEAYVAMLGDILPLLAEGRAPRIPQVGRATYTCQRIPADGEIEWRKNASDVHNLVRALKPPFPPAFTFLEGRKLNILETGLPSPSPRYVGAVPGRIVRVQSDGPVDVLAGNEVIEILRVGFEGEPPRPANAVLTSLKMTLGFDCKKEILELKSLIKSFIGEHS